MIIKFLSFGYRHGEPEADLIIDARKLKNPYGVEALKKFNGLNDDVQHFVRHDPRWSEWFPPSLKMVNGLIQHNIDNDMKDITIAVGCVGGLHRSVVAVLALAKNSEWAWSPRKGYPETVIHHRELQRAK